MPKDEHINESLLAPLWARESFRPDDNQKKAILHLEGPLYLPAGPGSGKTKVLLWRVLNLLVFHNVKPEDIFLSTFTEKAALQLREGLRYLLAIVTENAGTPYDISKMYVGTVHSLCQRILMDRRFSVKRQRTRAPIILDELSQYLYLRRLRRWTNILAAAGISKNGNEIVNGLFGESSNSRHQAIMNCISYFNRLSEEVIDPVKASRKIRNQEIRQLLALYRAYRDSLEHGDTLPRTDLSLLQQSAMEVLERFSDSGKVFKHVIIDEYQDTNTIQERLFFRLASGYKNICVVGDDDQALYRFRGAMVENFVDFPDRCQQNLGLSPRKVILSTNYRSRKKIVHFYNAFIMHSSCDWTRKGRGDGFYRVADKNIKPISKDGAPSVIASSPAHPDDVAEEVASLVSRMINSGKVENANQIAFLFPSLKSKQVQRMRHALEEKGLTVYAPRAGAFLEVEESIAMFGLFFHILGKPERGEYGGSGYQAYYDWIDTAFEFARDLIKSDSLLARYVSERQKEVKATVKDVTRLIEVVKRKGWDFKAHYISSTMREPLRSAVGLSQKASRSLDSNYFDRIARRREQEGMPFSLHYIVTRATSLDWNLLDLFYQICGFNHFRKMFELAEKGQDEGPVCNLSLISQYISKFIDEYYALITGEFLSEGRFLLVFNSFLYALFRRGESEYEDSEDPFPKGRIPFITIHQAKGLEFPVVILGNPRKENKGPQLIEKMVHPLLSRKGEPLDRMADFDIMRMFYVALSRAKNLLVIAHYKGQGQRVNEPFASMLDKDFPRIPEFDVNSLPNVKIVKDDLPQTYSYTGDYLLYQKCPRQYMIFRKYGFVPSRSQTMFFGSLVHQTLEDFHNFLIAERKKQ